MYAFSFTGLALVASVAEASLQIVPGATWTATNNGQGIQAHGGGMFKEGNKWYWVGEDKTDGSAFQNINCYSSSNLVDWAYEGAVLSRTASGDTGPNRVIERPKIVHNKKTGKYVLWMHIDSSNYGEAKAGVATGDQVCGKYTYIGSSQPLGFQSRDSSVFVDDDGKGYLLSEDRQNGLRIDALSDDYLNVTSSVHLFTDDYEAPALVKKNGVYFMFGSKLSGWAPNDNRYSTATSLAGPWSAWNTFADVGSNTYTSQTAFVLPIGDNFMYMGDRWHSENLMRSTYVWLPLTISGTTATMKNQVSWIIDPSTGAMSAAPSENTYQGPAATLANGAKVATCSSCPASTSSFAGNIGGPSNGSATFTSVQSSVATRTTIRIVYRNGDSTQRYAMVTVNGKTQTIAFFPTIDSDPGTSVANVELKQGANQITIAGINGGWGPDVFRVIVPVS